MRSVIVHRVGRRFTQHRQLPASYRCYSSPAEEPDPQLNGYPQLPWVSRQTLPPKGWQDEQLRRNFGDTLHEQDEVLSMWGPDPAPLPAREAVKQFVIAAFGFMGVGYIIKEYMTPEAPVVRRQYPFDGLSREMGGTRARAAEEF